MRETVDIRLDLILFLDLPYCCPCSRSTSFLSFRSTVRLRPEMRTSSSSATLPRNASASTSSSTDEVTAQWQLFSEQEGDVRLHGEASCLAVARNLARRRRDHRLEQRQLPGGHAGHMDRARQRRGVKRSPPDDPVREENSSIAGGDNNAGRQVIGRHQERLASVRPSWIGFGHFRLMCRVSRAICRTTLTPRQVRVQRHLEPPVTGVAIPGFLVKCVFRPNGVCRFTQQTYTIRQSACGHCQ